MKGMPSLETLLDTKQKNNFFILFYDNSDASISENEEPRLVASTSSKPPIYPKKRLSGSSEPGAVGEKIHSAKNATNFIKIYDVRINFNQNRVKFSFYRD